MTVFNPKNYRPRPAIVSVQRFVNLTMPLKEKMEIADANMGKCTIFVNKKHTLAHLVYKHDDVLVRIPITKTKLIKEIDQVVEAYLMVKLHHYLMGFEL